MTVRIIAAMTANCFFLKMVIGVAAFGLPAQCLLGATCSVVKHNPPSEADKAMLAADYAKAESLYKAGLAAHPDDLDATIGLVHSLFQEQKIVDAADAVKTALDATPKAADGTPNSASLLTLLGEVKFHQGDLWEVEPIVLASYKQDPCNPRTRLLFARISQANSRFSTARQQLGIAHQFDPSDPEIRQAWIAALPLKQQISEEEAFLASPEAQDDKAQKSGHFLLESLKIQDAAQPKACRLSAGGPSADIPFIRLMGFKGPFAADKLRAFGLEVVLDSGKTRLQIDTKTSGITLHHSVADRVGLKRIGDAPAGGDPNMKAYPAYAGSIHIGGLEFQNCTVTVLDTPSMFDDGDGFIGTDAFSQFLITLDSPMRKLLLAPLPAKPNATPAEVPSLLSTGVEPDDSAPGDRCIAPDLKDWTQFYHFGPNLLLPATLNGTKVKLFLLDAGTNDTTISTSLALDLPNVHEKASGGPGGKVNYVDDATFDFAHMSQKVVGVNASDTSGQSKAAGAQISGVIGWGILKTLTTHIDYRDGLVKFDYVPNRGYKFE